MDGLGTNRIANLRSVAYQPSITQESTHVYLPQTDLQHMRSAPGLGSQPECLDLIYSTKWNANTQSGAQGGTYLLPWRSPLYHLHLPKNDQMWNQPIELLFFIYFSCLKNSFFPSVPLEPGEGLLLWQMYRSLRISFGRISCTYLSIDMSHKKGAARIMWSMRRLFYMTDTPSGIDLETKASLCPLSIEVPWAFSSIHVLYTLRFWRYASLLLFIERSWWRHLKEIIIWTRFFLAMYFPFPNPFPNSD